jgi:hypothetical protein
MDRYALGHLIEDPRVRCPAGVMQLTAISSVAGSLPAGDFVKANDAAADF